MPHVIFVHISCCKLVSIRFSVKLQRIELKQELLRDFILEILIFNDVLKILCFLLKITLTVKTKEQRSASVSEYIIQVIVLNKAR